MLQHSILSLPPKYEHRILGLALITLHVLLWWGFPHFWLSRLLLLIHFCWFLLWQPLWAMQDSPDVKHFILLGIVMLASVAFVNPWIVTLWQILWIGLLGGRDLVKPGDRTVNLAAIIFLVLEIFTVNIHQLFILPQFVMMEGIVQDLLRYGLLCIPLAFLFTATDDTLEHRYHLDFFHGLTFTLLMIIIALGSLVLMSQGGFSYPLAVFQMSLATTLFIFTLSWLWIILADEKGMTPLWSRHLLNIGSSFEPWLDNLAQPSNYKNLTPQEFLRAGFAHLMSLPWVSGIAWHSLYGEDLLGKPHKYQEIITVQSLEVTIYSYYRISGSHYFQVKILIQLLEYLHQAKRREAAFAQQAHLQAIHETGAKLTHDIKSLLQSLYAITSVIEAYPPNQFGDTQRLLQGQMPHLTNRLKRTLDKLQKPAEFSYSHIPVSLWWGNLKARYRKRNINFISQTISDAVLVPEDLFDNVTENLIENALKKRKREPQIQIEVVLHINDKHYLKLTVCDDGSAIPDEICKNLLTKPVTSHEGFGIGLYQAVKQLTNTGYRLQIADNIEGQVCFELASAE